MKCFVFIFIQLKENYDLRKDPMELYSCRKEWQLCYSHVFFVSLHLRGVHVDHYGTESGRAKEVTV